MTELWVEYTECPACHQKHQAFLDKKERIGTMYCNVFTKSFIINKDDILEYIPQSKLKKE